MKEKIAHMLSMAFSVILAIGLIAALVGACLFVVAFVIGGDAAVGIASFVQTKLLPVEYRLAVVIAVIGIIKMYLCGEKTFLMKAE